MERLEDVVAIEQLYAEFCLSASYRDPIRLAGNFSDDGVWTNISKIAGMADVETVGRPALETLLTAALGGVEFSHVMIQPRVLGFDGDSARVECVFREWAKPNEQPVVLFFGRYEDKLVKTPKGWRINRRTTHPFGFYSPKAEFISMLG